MNIHAQIRRNGLTLAELLVATTITAMIVAALAVFTEAVMDGWDHATKTGTTTQTARVVLTRIANKVASSRQVLKMANGWGPTAGMDQVMVVWERDGEPNDTAPGQANVNELLIYATHKKNPVQLQELRPQVDPSLLVPLDEPTLLLALIDRFRNGQDIIQPAGELLNDLGGIHFDVEEYSEPQGIGGLVQQNVRISLCISPLNQPAAVFVGSASRRYVASTVSSSIVPTRDGGGGLLQ